LGARLEPARRREGARLGPATPDPILVRCPLADAARFTYPGSVTASRRLLRPTPSAGTALGLGLLGLLASTALAPERASAQRVTRSAAAEQSEDDRPRSQLRRISVSWTEAPIRDVLQAFAAFSGRSFVAGTGVDDVFVTADINDQPWDVALETILLSRGLTAVENEHGIIRVDGFGGMAEREAVEPIVTRTYRISYSRVSELQATIAPLLSDRGSVSVVESSNTLVVADIARVQRVVSRLLGDG